MASGDPVIEVLQVMPPGSSYATEDIRVGGSSPPESIPVYDFDAATIEYIDLLCEMSDDYDGGGITLTLKWSSTQTSGVTRWGAAFRRVADDAEDIDGSHSYDFNDVDCTTASAAGEVDYAQITFTDGADMDSVDAGELFILRLRRNASHANDNMSGDAELWIGSLKGKET
jgi:hypothetical protein